VLESSRSGLAALGHLARWPLPVDDEPSPGRRRDVRVDASASELLAAYGIPVVDSRPAASLDEVVAAADAVGYPAALKTVGVLHKTEAGGVALGITDEAALTAAYEAMAQRLGPAVTVETMVDGGVEISVGFVRDDAFGPLVVVAAGGTLVELMQDRAVACPPLSRSKALRMLDSLRVAPLLAGWRGAPAVDIDALADTIVRVSELAVDLGAEFDAIEANPVIATPHGVVAVDAVTIPRPP